MESLNKYGVWVACCFLLFIAGCGGDHYHQEKKVGDVFVGVDYLPPNEKNDIEYFKITLKQSGNEVDIVDFLADATGMRKEQILYYLSYQLEHDIYLEADGEKITSTLYHFERSYDLRKERVVNAGFPPLHDGKRPVSFVIDSDLLDVGKLKFRL